MTTIGEYQVKIAPSAVKELMEIVRYIAKENPANAHNFVTEVRNKINKSLSNNPHISPPPIPYPVLGVAGYRRLVVHKNYSVLFVIIGQTVEVRHILHNKRQWNVIVGGKSPN
ncbi:MAG: type II toxin-antitoxin system RelE/ParE family toxin [Bacillota bacterium]